MSPCKAIQYSDQMQCAACGLAWDVNDPDPPVCGRHTSVNLVPVINLHPKFPVSESLMDRGELCKIVGIPDTIDNLSTPVDLLDLLHGQHDSGLYLVKGGIACLMHEQLGARNIYTVQVHDTHGRPMCRYEVTAWQHGARNIRFSEYHTAWAPWRNM